MTLHIRYILLIISILTVVSCKDAQDEKRVIDPTAEQRPLPLLESSNPTSTLHGTLLLGKKIKITHESYGCFHYNATSLIVEEIPGKYLVTLNDQFLNKPIKSVHLNSSFGIALLNFSKFYASILNNQEKMSEKETYSLGTMNKLTIEGGLQKLGMFCNTKAELSGFYALVNSIKQYVID